MPLFHPRIIEKHTKAAAALPAAHADILSNWAESLAKGAFNRETSHDGEFIQRILIDVLESPKGIRKPLAFRRTDR